MPSSGSRPPSPTASAISPFPPCRSGKRCRRWWPNSPAPSESAEPPSPTVRPDCGCCRCSRLCLSVWRTAAHRPSRSMRSHLLRTVTPDPPRQRSKCPARPVWCDPETYQVQVRCVDYKEIRMTALKGATTLVTGGAGTIGSTIVDQLLAADVAKVRILDNLVRGRRANLAQALTDPRVELVVGDLRDIDLVHDMTKGSDLVFHEAAIRITQCAEEPRLALQVLVDGTFTVLEAAAEHKVDKIVAASSASVYGLAEEFPTTERHHHHNNDTFYGAAKSFNEGMLRSFRAMYGLDYIALRPFNVYGPRMDIHGLYTEVLIRWMERIADGRSPLLFGDGAQTMDFVNTVDIARAHLLAAASPIREGVYNVASGTETSLADLARALLAAMDSDLPLEYGPARAVNGVTRRLASTDAAERDLGFRAEIDLETGLRELVAWWRAEQLLAADLVAVPAGTGA